MENSVVSDAVSIGSRVRVLDLEYNEEDEYQIVGSQEADPTVGRISDESPIGKAMMGRKTGETISVEAPGGSFQYKILDVSY